MTATTNDTTSWTSGQISYKKKDASLNSLKLIRGSLLNMEDLDKVISGADCVIHCASYGMSGKEQMPSEWSRTEQVNITGTENVLKCCQKHGVRGLVYTSSFNVVFGGQEIVNGNESLPYFPLHQHEDHYSRTKAIAERLVLYSDNLKSPSPHHHHPPLRTCALRLAGVFGLGEKRHLPRIVDYFDFLIFRYGDNTLQQFSTIRNVVQGHVRAAEHLISNPERVGGQAYFISDEVPINSFDFFRPLREALGYRQPKMSIPLWVIWAVVYFSIFFHSLLSRIHPRLNFTPFLTTAEAYKTSVTHYFSSGKAKRDFGYVPERPNDLSDVIQYYCEKKGREKTVAMATTAVKVICFTIFMGIFLHFYFIL